MLGLAQNHTIVAATNLLLLADGRFPAGGYAHSTGLEQAVESGRVDSEPELRAFLDGVLATVARTGACFAAASCETWRTCDPTDVLAKASRAEGLERLALEESARMPAPALREASRTQGRQFIRAAQGTWPTAGIPKADIVPFGVHLSMAQGLVAAALDLDPRAAALISAYGAVLGPATAAVKLLGLDPLAVNRIVAESSMQIAELVDEAGDLAACAPQDLPSRTAPLLEIGSALHAVRQPRMFAS
ncbi:MAG: urease accessory protein UreF [Thermoleophilaceae bacterium]|nr:urease accessory protein UreF [Thermoleophilaceae bacterium]